MNDEVRMQYELEALYSRYAEVLDDGPLSEWPLMFTEECMYKVVPRDNFDRDLPLAIIRCESRGMLEDRVRSVEDTMMYEPRYLRHHITNIRVKNEADGVIDAVANYSVIEVLHDELPKILSVGRYLDKIVRADDGRLLFTEKLCVYDSVLVPNTIVYPL